MGNAEHNRYSSHTFNEMGHKSGVGFLKKSRRTSTKEKSRTIL